MEMNNGLVAGATAIAGASLGSIPVAAVPVATTVPAAGIAGWLGFTTTTIVSAPITVPVGSIIAAGALLTYGGYRAYQWIKKEQATL